MKIINYLPDFFSSLILSKTAKNTYLVFVGNSAAIFFAFLFTVFLVRLLSISDFGYFSALLSFLLMTADIADLGIGNSLSRFLPPLKERKEKLLGFIKAAFVLQFFIAVFLTIMISLFSSYLTKILFRSSSLNFLLSITAIGIFTVIMFNFFQYVFSAQEEFIKVAFGAVLGGLLRLVLLALLFLFSLITLTNIIWIQNISFFILLVSAFILIKLKFLRAKMKMIDLKKLISFTSYIGIARALTSVAGKLDVIMLIALRSPVEAGIYAIAAKIISVYPLFSGSFTTVIAPKIASINNDRELEKYLIKVIIATTGLVVTVIFFIAIASPFMVILFGEKAIPAIPILRLLLVSMIFFVSSTPAVSLAIYYLKKPQILTVNSILQLVIVIIGNFYFIPRLGIFGPAISLIIAYGVTLLSTSFLSFYYLRKKK